MNAEERLKDLGINLSKPPIPAAMYIPCVTVGKLVFVSGQGPVAEGKNQYEGRLGESITEVEAKEAAKLCARNMLAQLQLYLGNLDKIKRVVNLKGYVACTDDYKGQAQIINSASELMAAVFGENGKHTRCALGTNALPTGIPVEVEGIFELY